MKNHTTSLVPAGYFDNPQPVTRPTGGGPLLQWFNGLPAGKSLAIGWHIQASRCNDELSAALKGLGIERLTVLHRMSGELVEYWSLGAACLIVLCNGFADPWEMRQSEERLGIAYGWNGTKHSSKLKVKVLVAELVEASYLEPFTITLEGMITECFLEALSQQFQVLDAFEKLARQLAPFWGFSLTLAPADKPKMVGQRGKQSPIIPMVAAVPQVVDEEYLCLHLVEQPVIRAIVERDLVSKAIQWSIDTSHRISAGEDKEHWEDEASLPPDEEEDEEPDDTPMATKQQQASIEKLCQFLSKPMPSGPLTYEAARKLIAEMTSELSLRKAQQKAANTKSR